VAIKISDSILISPTLHILFDQLELSHLTGI